MCTVNCTESVRDLRIVLRNDFKWSKQIQQVTSTATRLVFTMLKSFKAPEPSFYVNLYKTHIRPIIEYNSSIWNPSLIKETQNIEKTQRKFTKYLCKKTNIKFSHYFERLAKLNLESLEEGRLKLDLIILYKILNNLIEIDFKDHFQLNLSSRQHNLRGHNRKLFIPKYQGTSIRQNFFIHRVLPLWNNLPQHIVNSENLIIFKNNLNKYSIYNIYNTKLNN